MILRPLCIGLVMLSLAACTTGGLNRSPDGVFAPGVARGQSADGLIVGHRLMAAGEYELALKAYNRAAAQQGLNVDTMSAIGSANLNLGRLGIRQNGGCAAQSKKTRHSPLPGIIWASS